MNICKVSLVGIDPASGMKNRIDCLGIGVLSKSLFSKNLFAL
jgi:hypothetical protein